MFKKLPLLACAAILSLASSVFAQEMKPVYYDAGTNVEKSLPYKVLKLALAKSGEPYEIQPANASYSNTAAQIDAIFNGAQLSVVAASASKKAMEKVMPVPFPIDGGLLGWRIFLIDGRRQGEFDQVKDLNDLKKFIALQGKGWADVITLREAGLTVRTGPRPNLYRMTIGQRGDHFARAVNEALVEQASMVAKVPELAVEKTLVLRYPAAQIFYVAKDNVVLHDVILKGLKAAHADGSYRELFLSDDNVQAALTKGNLKERKIIDIANPNFPDQLKSIDKQYWFDPSL